jgi:hypothetical protein
MTTRASSPAQHPVRPPNAEERRQLAGWLQSAIGYSGEEAALIADAAYAAVFDSYSPDSPGYAGKVMSVVWGAGPSTFDVFIWEGGTLVRTGREYDPKEWVVTPSGFRPPFSRQQSRRTPACAAWKSALEAQ